MKPAAPTHRSSSDQRSAVPLLRFPNAMGMRIDEFRMEQSRTGIEQARVGRRRHAGRAESAMLSPMTRMSVGTAVWRSASINRPPRMMIFSGLGTVAPVRDGTPRAAASCMPAYVSDRAGCSDPTVDFPQIVVGIAEIGGVGLPGIGFGQRAEDHAARGQLGICGVDRRRRVAGGWRSWHAARGAGRRRSRGRVGHPPPPTRRGWRPPSRIRRNRYRAASAPELQQVAIKGDRAAADRQTNKAISVIRFNPGSGMAAPLRG